MKRILFMLLAATALTISCGEDDTVNPRTDCTDVDGDGICADEDCNDNDADVFIGAVCNDNNSNTFADVYGDNCNCSGVELDSITDSRDGQIYKTIQYGPATWMAENLNYETTNSKCYQNDFNCTRFGRLYTWTAARSACPNGWHLATDSDWNFLAYYVGGTEIQSIWLNIGGSLKATGNSTSGSGLWGEPNEGATNKSGFGGLPGGYYYSTDFHGIGSEGYWWTATQNQTSNAYVRKLRYDSDVLRKETLDKERFLSCRCVQN